MIILLISILLISATLLIIGFVFLGEEHTITPKNWTPFIQTLLSFILGMLLVVYTSKEQKRVTESITYKKALVENPYEIKVLYDIDLLNNTIPYDTVYIKKEQE